MSVIIQEDEFTREGDITTVAPAAWGVFNADNDWRSDNAVVRPYGVDANGSANVLHRAMMDSFNPGLVIQTDSPPLVQGGPTQRFSVTADITTPEQWPSSGDTYLGVFTFGSNPSTNGRGIEAAFYRDSGGTQDIRFSARDTAGVATFLTSSTPSPLWATAERHTIALRVEVYNASSATAFWAVDGIDVGALVLNLAAPYLSWLANFEIGLKYSGLVSQVDGSTIVVSPGSAQTPPPAAPPGTYVEFPPAFDNYVFRDLADSTLLGRLNPMPTLTTASALATTILDAETTPASGSSLPVNPAYVVPVEDQIAVFRFASDSGHVAAHPKSDQRRPLWRLKFGPMTTAEKTSLRDFIVAVGRDETWTWTHPDTTETLTLRIKSEDQAIRQEAPGVWTGGFVAEEVAT